MDILVTGSNGFIGSYLFEKLKGFGHTVSGFNSKDDINDYLAVEKAVKGRDIVFHLAGVSRVVEIEKDWGPSLKVNVDGTQNMSIACRTHGVKMVFASTGHVYGNQPDFPIHENAMLLPVSLYGQHKQLAEESCDLWNDFIVRLGSVYGPSPKSHNVVNRFIKKILAKSEIKKYYDMVTRDFIYIDDAVDALILGIDHVGVYNVGTGIETSIETIIEKISKIANVQPKVVDEFEQMSGMVYRIVLDISKMRSIGWSPTVDLDEGIRRCLPAVSEDAGSAQG